MGSLSRELLLKFPRHFREDICNICKSEYYIHYFASKVVILYSPAVYLAPAPAPTPTPTPASASACWFNHQRPDAWCTGTTQIVYRYHGICYICLQPKYARSSSIAPNFQNIFVISSRNVAGDRVLTISEWKKIRRVILIESQHRYYKKTHMPFPVGLALRVCKEVYWDALPMCVVPITLGTYWLSLKRNENDDLVHSSSTPRAIMAGLVVGYTFPVSFPVITAYKFIFPRDITMERFCMGDSWEQSVKTVDRKVN